jgi:DNA (cytosine-5)-methyltransferase 1
VRRMWAAPAADRQVRVRKEEQVNVLSLFAGIGGLELGLERSGMTVVGQVEINPYCRRVLAKHWPEVPRHDDVRTAPEWWTARPRPVVDLVAGGPPCQDISNAHTNGARLGLAGAKSGLWSAYRDLVEQLEPRWVLVENVSAWERWVPGVRGQLHELGYASVPVQVSAGSLGAPHKRPRVLVVAHAHGEGEPLRAIHVQVAGLRPVPRGGGRDWRDPFAGAVRVDDGVPGRMDRARALGNAVVPAVGEFIGRLILAAESSRVALEAAS